MYCSREYFKTSTLIQQYEKSTPNQSFRTANQVDIDCISHPAPAPYNQNRQNPSLGQVRSNRCSGYNQSERVSKNNQNGRQTVRDRYPMEAQHILQRIEQENSIRCSQTYTGNHNQVTPQVTWLGS